MPSIVYGGVSYIQVRNAIYCKNCLDTIESNHTHDFKYCYCKSVGIDGELSETNRVIGDIEYIENRGMYCAIVQKKKIWLPQSVIEYSIINRKNQILNKYLNF